MGEAMEPRGVGGIELPALAREGKGTTDAVWGLSGKPTGARASGDPSGPGPGPPRDPGSDAEREGGVATLTRRKVARPPRYKVLLFNDDYTPMEFVVQLLERIFGKGPSEANAIMLAIHRGGVGVAGVYVLEVAETKVSLVHRAAEERGYPLRAGVEKE